MEKEFILPSGVKMCVRELKGRDQGTLTRQGGNGSDKFNQMLYDCTIRLGDLDKGSGLKKTNITGW